MGPGWAKTRSPPSFLAKTSQCHRAGGVLEPLLTPISKLQGDLNFKMLPESTPFCPAATTTTLVRATIASHLGFCSILPVLLTSILPPSAFSWQSGQSVLFETQVDSCFSLFLGPPVASHFFQSKSKSCPMTWPLTASLISTLSTYPTSLLRNTDFILPKPQTLCLRTLALEFPSRTPSPDICMLVLSFYSFFFWFKWHILGKTSLIISFKIVTLTKTPHASGEKTKNNNNKKNPAREFSGGPGVRTLDLHCQGRRFNPWSHKLRDTAKNKIQLNEKIK